MPPTGDFDSVTAWLDGLRAGDRDAADRLWGRFFSRLVRLARTRLIDDARRAADEEDVALEAMFSFCRAAEEGRLPDLRDRDSLWGLLAGITLHKAADLIRRETAGKRDARRAVDLNSGEVAEWADRAPSPEFAAQSADEIARLIGMLGDGQLRRIAIHKLEGMTNAEIADRLGCATPTVERRVRLIRAEWAEAV